MITTLDDRYRKVVTEALMKDDILRFNGALEHDPAIDLWFEQRNTPLGTIAHHWFQVMRGSGDEVRELVHDGCPVACLGDAPFAYVNVFKAHVNVGFYHGAFLRDPARLLLGSGKRMRHVKITAESTEEFPALATLIQSAWADIKARVENG